MYPKRTRTPTTRMAMIPKIHIAPPDAGMMGKDSFMAITPGSRLSPALTETRRIAAPGPSEAKVLTVFQPPHQFRQGGALPVHQNSDAINLGRQPHEQGDGHHQKDDGRRDLYERRRLHRDAHEHQ